MKMTDAEAKGEREAALRRQNKNEIVLHLLANKSEADCSLLWNHE
jgi:hypothetical protein